MARQLHAVRITIEPRETELQQKSKRLDSSGFEPETLSMQTIRDTTTPQARIETVDELILNVVRAIQTQKLIKPS